MPKLLVPLNFSTSNLVYVTVDLKDVKDFEDFPKVDCGADKPEVESSNIVFRKGLLVINLK